MISRPEGIAPGQFRALMGAVPAPVTVVTATTDDGTPHGTTVSAFCSVSLEPPLIAVMLDRSSDLLKIVNATQAFGVNLLQEAQSDLALSFARKGLNKFEGVAWSEDGGLPRLTDAMSWVACSVEHTIEAGDHIVVLGRVLNGDLRPAPPLIYHQQTFGTHSGWQVAGGE